MRCGATSGSAAGRPPPIHVILLDRKGRMTTQSRKISVIAHRWRPIMSTDALRQGTRSVLRQRLSTSVPTRWPWTPAVVLSGPGRLGEAG
jgi:hypothetical protein